MDYKNTGHSKGGLRRFKGTTPNGLSGIKTIGKRAVVSYQ
jgi:hypothetical protein